MSRPATGANGRNDLGHGKKVFVGSLAKGRDPSFRQFRQLPFERRRVSKKGPQLIGGFQ